jgi:1-acyl-sn-glycerol-3-phosphate acyltransferase
VPFVRQRLLGSLRTFYEYAALYFGLGFLGILCLVWSPVALVLPWVLPAARATMVGRWGVTLGFRIYVGVLSATRACRFDLAALDTLRHGPPLIIAPNHPGLLDAVLVISRLPVTCIMKAELERNFFLGAGARLAGFIANDSVRRMIDRSIAAIRQGTHLLVFPEGTRTTQAPVNPFTGSIGIIARHAKVPVQTVFIDTDSPYLSKGWPLLRKPAMPITYRVRLGRRFDPPETARELVGELERYFAAELASGTMMQSWLPARTTAQTAPNRRHPGPRLDHDAQPVAHASRSHSQL